MFPLRAQTQSVRDSSAFRTRQLIAPAALFGSGTLIHCCAHESWDFDIRDWSQTLAGGSSPVCFEDWLQYVPVAIDLGLDFLGADAEHGFLDRLMAGALAYTSETAVVWSVKSMVKTLRPNGCNDHSFPSGHTAFVFTGAELVRLEYGWGWGSGAYCMAAAVASMRVYHNWHWLSDILAGAGIGILSANIGYWLLEPTKSLFGIDSGSRVETAVLPTVDSVSGTLCTTLAIRF